MSLFCGGLLALCVATTAAFPPVVHVTSMAMAPLGAPVCTTDLDCSLNGVCSANVCVCDPGWNGTLCDTLMFEPALQSGVYGSNGSDPFAVTSWGGNAIWDNSTQLWHLYVTEIARAGCGLHAWQGQSTVVHATATSVLGPYLRRSTAIQHQAHNPQTIKWGDKWYIFHIGSGNSNSPPQPCNESLPPRKTPALDTAVAQCPTAPALYTKTESACMSDSKCSGPHCNCATNLIHGVCNASSESDTSDVQRCLANVTAYCNTNPLCHSFALRTIDCASTSAVKWQAFALGTGATVPNSDWTSYTKPAPPPPPTPPPQIGGKIHVSETPFGPFTALDSSNDLACNNPSPAVHPNGTVFLACTWTLRSSTSIQGPWENEIAITPSNHSKRPNGVWEDPFLFFDRRGNFHILAHVYGQRGQSAFFPTNAISGHAFSEDGINWTFSNTQPYSNTVQQIGGGAQTFSTLERPKLMFGDATDPHRPTALFNGASPWWDAEANATNPCSMCAYSSCTPCKVTSKSRGDQFDLDWTYTIGRPVAK
eukprot:m.91933 g.91933  ORF g.91933 m.91933 type:complete len:536 (-) comp26511_c1_seq1:143-1750(-)